MVDSNQVYFIQDHLVARQCLVNVQLYRNKFGLFLNDEGKSELDVIASCDNHKSCGDTLISSSCKSHRSVLTGVDDVQALFTHERKGFVVLHVGQLHNSYSRLKITRPCFDELLRRANICHALKDNILHIGFRTMDCEVAPPAPSMRLLYDVEKATSPICGLEIAYGLRFIEANERDDGDPWSLRQCVVYNKTKHTQEFSQWLFFSLPGILREQVDDAFDTFQRDLVLRPFDVHLMIFSTAINMWRPYFVHVATEVESCRNKVNMADPRSHESLKNVREDTLLILKDYEIDMLNAMLAIRATRRTLTDHQSLCREWYGSRQASVNQHYASSYDLRFSELFRRLDGALDQAQSLLDKVRSISETVANFLALASSYSAENLAEQSKCLAELSRRDSIRMGTLTEIAQKDTKAVKALSVITLIYLPITVVLNFFSTSFVSENDGEVQVVGRWWLLVATSVPLTVLTLVAWSTWICRNKLRRPFADLEKGLSPAVAEAAYESSDDSLKKAWS